jgi:hypothetical protein
VYVIDAGELKIGLANMEAIMKWPIPTNVTEVGSFFGAAQYLRKFIASFSVVLAPLHAITANGKSFQWGKNQQKAFDELKRKIDQAPMLTLPNLQKPFEVETVASGYAMGAVLTQGGRPIYYHSEVFHGAVLNYPTYDKELYALVQVVKKWKHYLMGKETIIHTNHRPLQYFQAQSKLQQTRHYKWMRFLRQFHLVNKYKKDSTNKLVDMLSRPPTSKITALVTLVHMEPFTHDAYKETYTEDEDFKEVFRQLQGQIRIEKGDDKANYYFQNGLLYKLDKLCVPKGERLQFIREAHTSKVIGHFSVGKTVVNLQRYVYWPKMQENVARYIRGCILCCTSKPNNKKQGLYHPLLVPTRPWKSFTWILWEVYQPHRRGMTIYL